MAVSICTEPAAARSEATKATVIGSIAILLWSSLVALATMTGALPPFQLVAMAFSVAFLLGFGKRVLSGESWCAYLRQPPLAWLLGVGGLFGYHAFYFVALRLAPPVETSLINYLWPLLIVVGAASLPGERLGWWHIAGACAGLGGTVLLVTGGGAAGFSLDYGLGYAAAFGAAVTWAGYSILSRRMGEVPTEAVGGFCGATALLALICHLMLEQTIWPEGGQWLAVLAMGLGPVGAAFFLWDYGMKRGNIKALGGFSYAAPLLSTFLLILLGKGSLTPTVAAAGVLIVGGAVLASRDLWDRPRA